MKVFVSPSHDKTWRGNAMIRGILKQHHDCAERSVEIYNALKEDLKLPIEYVENQKQIPDEIYDIHTKEYLNYLACAWREWNKSEEASFEVRPYITTNRYFPELRTKTPVTLAGYYLGDGGSPITEGAWENMLCSVHTVAKAADAIISGERSAYALLRPAGHHAMRDMALGGCHIGNTALAVQRISKNLGKVAVLDIDVHHGNGTQQIFYDRNDILTISLHGKPQELFPFLCGFSDEQGTGNAIGYNINIPLETGATIKTYGKELEKAILKIKDFDPAVLVVATGYDTYRYDPFGNLWIETKDYKIIGNMIAQLGLPTLFVQEGGYKVDALRSNVNSFLDGYLSNEQRNGQ